ncbi:unnamed protein product [Schistocephalus solidus]|uniref:Uncharacterized protein n=1 Tax=Schistocephalus solidus TaxID=70667 RepID=A0A3P7C1N4_SCHSO|nr:unnamed protein product [Schistocephalus solidus]
MKGTQPRQPPASSLASGLLDSVLTGTQSRQPPASCRLRSS